MTPAVIGNLSGWHFVILLLIILLLFGAPKLPALAKSLGQSMKILKKEVSELGEDEKSPAAGTGAQSTAQTAAQPGAEAEPQAQPAQGSDTKQR